MDASLWRSKCIMTGFRQRARKNPRCVVQLPLRTLECAILKIDTWASAGSWTSRGAFGATRRARIRLRAGRDLKSGVFARYSVSTAHPLPVPT